MKKKFFVVLAVLFTAFSCTQDEAFLENWSDVETAEVPSFNVIEESELSGAELFANAMGQEAESVDPELYKQINQRFIESFNELPNAGIETRATIPAFYKTVRVEYQTLDQDNLPVTVSATIVYPLLKKIKNVMLINHGSLLDPFLASGKYSSMEAVMAATGALCILPDEIGTGSSSNHPSLYMNANVNGRVAADALFKVLDYAKTKKLSMDTNYKSYIIGYSQGGFNSLAALKYIQTLDQTSQTKLHLTKVLCGGGIYDMKGTYESYVNDSYAGKNMAHGVMIPCMLNGIMNSYYSSTRALYYDNFFTDWAMSTGVPQAVHTNGQITMDDMTEFSNVPLNQILDFEYAVDYYTIYKNVLKLMDRQNLCTGWAPAYSVKLMHCNQDGVVPFSNFEKAVAGLNNQYLESEVIDVSRKNLDAMGQHSYGMLVMIDKVLSGRI